MLVEAGDSISADLRLIESSNLAVDESMLSGESIAVDKSTQAAALDARLSERSSMLFKGTSITRGSGVGVVTAIGLATEVGHVSQLVAEAEPGVSPLERKLERLSGQLVWATLAVAGLLAATGAATGEESFLVVESAIALAVAAIPEGLPIVATLALARGMWRMARQNALIERLSAVETPGATTVILTDKTGTLTENRMTVRRLWLPSGEVELDSDAPGRDVQASLSRESSQLARLLEMVVLCNDATLGHGSDGGSGDPMESALLRAGLSFGIERGTLVATNSLARKYAFDAACKMMATVHRQGERVTFAIKGAPEAVLAAAVRVESDDGEASLDDEARAKWSERVAHLGRHGLRVLACARKTGRDETAPPYEGLTFLGLIGLEDPARKDVPHAIQACQQAGIRVVMVTGDHAVTARSIGSAVGLGTAADKVVEGRDLPRIVGQRGNDPP